jgi:broad specificity phosphatase PhoE
VILARGQSVLRELAAKPEKAVLVVSHAGFLRVGVTGRYFMNADWRVFEFEGSGSGSGGSGDGEEGEEGVRLKEWEETEKGGMGWSWDKVVPLGDGLPDADGVVRGG